MTCQWYILGVYASSPVILEDDGGGIDAAREEVAGEHVLLVVIQPRPTCGYSSTPPTIYLTTSSTWLKVA